MRFFRWIFRLATAALLLASAVAGAALYYLGTGLSTTAGSLRVQGLDAPVEIFRDEYGIPYVYAQNERDLWFALGLLHAQDRLVQLETTRLIGQGRLAEIAGARALPLDRFNRVLGLARKRGASMRASRATRARRSTPMRRASTRRSRRAKARGRSSFSIRATGRSAGKAGTRCCGAS